MVLSKLIYMVLGVYLSFNFNHEIDREPLKVDMEGSQLHMANS